MNNISLNTSISTDNNTYTLKYLSTQISMYGLLFGKPLQSQTFVAIRCE